MKNTLLTLALGLAVSSIQAGTEPGPKNPIPPSQPPAPACNTISYDFAELEYHHLFSDYESDGIGAHISKTITGNLFGFGSYNQFFDGTELISFDAGLGYHFQVTSCVDFVVKAACVYDDDIWEQTWSGLTGAGFRVGLAQWLQLDVFYHGFIYDFEDYISSGSAALIFREVLAPKVDVIVSGAVGEDDYQQVSAGLRYNF